MNNRDLGVLGLCLIFGGFMGLGLGIVGAIVGASIGFVVFFIYVVVTEIAAFIKRPKS